MQLKNPNVVRVLRLTRGLAQADLALACGVSPATLSNIERGRSQPSTDVLRRLADALGCDPELLVRGIVRVGVRGDPFSTVTVSNQVEARRTSRAPSTHRPDGGRHDAE